MLAVPLILACSGPDPATLDTDPATPDPAEDAATCARYAEVVEGLEEGVWAGDVGTCDAASPPDVGVEGAVAMVSYARELAGLPPMVLDTDTDTASAAQDCALMMHANDALSHDPPETWSCWTQGGADAAAVSLLAREPALGAVLQYLVDFGNETSLVHRRWLLNPGLDRIALGSTDAFSCLRLGSTSLNSTGWVAWPPPGRVPLEMLSERNSSVDVEGWSIQSDDLDLADATVTVVHDGERLPQVVEPLGANQGSEFALRFVPDGFVSEPGEYRVEVGGIAEPFEYEVRLVGCDTL